MFAIPKQVYAVCHQYWYPAAKAIAKNLQLMMLLKKVSKDLIIENVIRGTSSSTSETKSPGEIHWKVLVLDHVSSKIVSRCCGMHDITAEGVTLVEDLHKRREPLPFLEAIYVLKPTDEDSINHLFRDLDTNPPLYKAFHIFCIETCPLEVVDRLATVLNIRRVKSFKEICMSFIPYESHVFLLEENDQANRLYYKYSKSAEDIRMKAVSFNIDRIAGQIATLCASLGENPSIRYRSAYPKNEDLALMVDLKLQELKTIDSTLGEGTDKSRSQLIILDRGFDCTSPILHELTFEAMIYDLLPIENGAYKYKGSKGEEKIMFLDDNSNSTWQELKHMHIAEVSQKVSEEFKKFMQSKNVDTKGGQMSMRDLQVMVKKLPQYQKEINVFNSQMSMAEDCLKVYERIKLACDVEQDLATGTDANGEKIRDYMNQMNPILLDVDRESGFNDYEKLRLILLYIISKNGITEESLTQVLKHSNIDPKLREVITNLSLLGPNVVVTGGIRKEIQLLERINRQEQKQNQKPLYTASRWIPILKDILEFATMGRLDTKNFPYQVNRCSEPGYKIPTSTRFGNWYPKGGNHVRSVPRLIIFVVGGISLSEIRTVYEVNKSQADWEVVIGSTEVLTPKKFLENLERLS